jgi:flagellar FliL protein
MSEEGDDVAAEEGAEGEGKKKVGGKKLILFIVLPILLVGGGVGAAFTLGLLDSLLGTEQAEEEMIEETPAEPEIKPPGVFYPLEELTVSLSTQNNTKRSYLVLEVQLELPDDAAVLVVKQKRPKIISEFTVFLRELRPEELSGSDGAYLVREELYRRVSQVLAPTQVDDLLLVKMLIQ